MKIPAILKISLVFFIVTLGVGTGQQQDNQNSIKQSDKQLSEPGSTVTRQQAWGLSCAAILTERNHGNHELLGTELKTEKSIEHYRFVLADSGFAIMNKEDLLNILMWLESEGHRREFERLGQQTQDISEEEYQKLLDEYQADSELLNRLKVARKYYPLLGEKSILGWDYGRYINLCRWAYMADYLSQEEALEKIMITARYLQSKFQSWQQLGQNYLIGRLFWSLEESEDWGYQYEDAYLRLLEMPLSPWNKLPWDMDLTTESPTEKSKQPDENSENLLI